jgi:hypothetical protein
VNEELQPILFGRDVDCDRVDHILNHDWDKFSAIAFCFVGTEHRWLRAVDELFWLYALYQREGRDASALDKIFDLLAERTAQLREPGAKMAHLFAAIYPDAHVRPRPRKWAGATPAGRHADASRKAMDAIYEASAAARASDPRFQSRLGK